MLDGIAGTPRYVLKDGALPICPLVVQSPLDVQITVIFGFSDKPSYDLFLTNTSLALMPYPLVQGFLKNQMAEDVDCLRLIVLDAESPESSVLFAATTQAVVDSLHGNSKSVAISHHLVFDATASAYRVEVLADVTPEKLVS